jgi:ABC-2 type transport system permease protein
MSVILVLLRKDFANFFRNKAAVSLTFVVPFALIYIFGFVFGVNNKDTGPSGIPLAVVNASDNPAALKLIEALKAEKTFRVITDRANPDKSRRPLTETDLEPMMRDNAFRFALVIPSDLLSTTTLGIHLKFYSNPRNEIETQTVNGMLQKTIFSNVPQLLGQSLQARAKGFLGDERFERFNSTLAGAISSAFGGKKEDIQKRIESGDFGLTRAGPVDNTGAPGAAQPAKPDLLSQLVRIETTQVVGKDVKSPAATRIVGGWAMQFLLFALSASAASLFYERDYGILQRVLAAPVSRSQILLSKFCYGVCLGLTQLLVLFLAGRVLYGIDVEHHWGFLILVCTFAAAACTSFGMLLAAVVSTPEAASGLATLLILLMSAIGGAWFPTSLMPEFIQKISKLTLVYWSMEGFSQVLWANATFVELLPTLGILAGITAAVMAIAMWRFNRGKIFG